MYRVGVQTMSLTQGLSRWVDDNLGRLEASGAVTLCLSDPDADKPSAHLLVRGSREGELILWDSGEVEVWVDPMSVEEHHEIDDPAALAPVLADFLDRLTRE